MNIEILNKFKCSNSNLEVIISVKVKLSDIVEGMELQSDEVQAYLNKKTGQVVTVTEEDMHVAEFEEDLEDYPE